MTPSWKSLDPPKDKKDIQVELNRSRNADHHVGYLTIWSLNAHRKKYFPAWEKEEILSEAFIQATRLLAQVYAPDKSTVVTFLKSFLWGAVHYRYWTSQGFRFTDAGPILKLRVTTGILCEDLTVESVEATFDLPDLSEEEWTIVRLRQDGYTMTRIATVLGLKSPQSVYNRLVRIRDKFEGIHSNATNHRATPPPHRSRSIRKTLS